MVVVSGNWVRHVATYPTPTINNMMVINNSSTTNTTASTGTLQAVDDNNKMTAKAVLICRPNSHPFQDRTLTLDQPVKVGRSVARARATPTNAIFDCKVLSRNHALLWYENGKFYLKDTTSSNGTFVNNNRLLPEVDHHEVSSGDIVQFGVDVMENNRKITHGCIIGTLKLYLPDGKEAKASPSISDNNTQVVPLDELYKLHQIIQEATQREHCLETKLIALQSLVEEAKKSADESWQAYVGEERLLSRISVLETQIQQAGKNWSEDKYREEILKLQNDNSLYQTATKEALDKLHSERLEALAVATEQKRLRISTEQEVILIKEQLALAQRELEEVAQKLSEEQKKAAEEKTRLENERWELQRQLDSELEKKDKVKNTKVAVTSWLNKIPQQDFDITAEKCWIYDDVKSKEELIAAEENCESEMNKTNGLQDDDNQVNENHINVDLTKYPQGEAQIIENDNNTNVSEDKDNSDISSETSGDDTECEKRNSSKRVSFAISSDEEKNHTDGVQSENKSTTDENEKDDFDSDNVDSSKTLKYKYQSTQNELKKQIELLESTLEQDRLKISELEKALMEEKSLNCLKIKENESLKDELVLLQQEWKETCNESQQLKDRLNSLTKQLEIAAEQDNNKNVVADNNDVIIMDQSVNNLSTISTASLGNSSISYEEFVHLEEELVVLKERYSQINEEKLKLYHELVNLKQLYNNLCNRSYDRMYYYIAPLILVILYLVISAMIS